MYKNKHLLLSFLVYLLLPLLARAQQPLRVLEYSSVTTGAERFNDYLPLLNKKRVGIVTNVTGEVAHKSIVDTLLSLGVRIVKIFGPEHGFRSNTEAGQHVKNNKDARTGIPVISLYGANKKPSREQLKNVDVLIYDIQDIGVRFYTYISTLTYVIKACAENKKALIILDRPNPNGFYIDGPVLTSKYRSFLGLHPVPIVYGMTCGEYAQMVNGEGWLNSDTAAFQKRSEDTPSLTCSLTVITMKNYDRNCSYYLPVKPSPNIPNSTSVLLYPSLGLFEGTIASLGRGTSTPFQVLGHPSFPDTSFAFTPLPTELNKEPRYVNKRCYGLDLRHSDYIFEHPHQLELRWLLRFSKELKELNFFEQNFNYHSGNNEFQEQLKDGKSPEEIRKAWQPGIEAFKKIREKYLLYGDFQ
jgi:uncharacterized protein YbbC (DUF1343 family)